MRRLITLAVLFICLAPAGAEADLPDEHPEWYGYTAPFETQETLRLSSLVERAWVAPEAGDYYAAALLAALRPEAQVTILARGGEDQLALYEWLEDEDLHPAELNWLDVEALDTPYAGEWGPTVLFVGESATSALLDGRYYSLRAADDAVPGRISDAAAAPLHRIPLFLSSAFFQATPDGLCLAGPEIYNMNIGHGAAEIDFALRTYAGCVAVVAVPTPANDLKKKPMDLYLRLTGEKASAGDGTAWGVFLGETSGWSLSLQQGLDDIRDILNAVSGDEAFIVVEIPWPETADGAIRSYLPYVRIDGAVIVPTYMGVPTAEETMTATLLAELGPVEIRGVPSDLAAQLERWPSRLVAGGTAAAWADLEAPEQLCPSGDPADCGQCLHECGVLSATCHDGPDGPGIDACIEGADGCFDKDYSPCPDGQICTEGACEDPPTTCDTLPAGGICQGNTVVRCIAGQVVEVDCLQDSKLCAYEEDGTAACFFPCGPGCETTGETTCGEAAAAVLTCEVGPEGCPEWVESLCPAGQICLDGACIEGSLDVQQGDADTGDGGPAGDWSSDATSVNAGYGGSGGCTGCVISTRPEKSLASALLVLLALFGCLYKRRSLP